MSYRLLADENLSFPLVNGLLRLMPSIDFLRVQDAGLSGIPDPEILAWAAVESRIVVSHDVNTMTHHANERIYASLPFPGLIIIHRQTPIGIMVRDLHVMLSCSTIEEFENHTSFIPIP